MMFDFEPAEPNSSANSDVYSNGEEHQENPSSRLKKIEYTVNLLKNELLDVRNYLMINKDHYLMKFGVSYNYEKRLKRHQQDGWIPLGSEIGSLEREKTLKRILREAGFKPMPGSTEIFKISSELLAMLIAYKWVAAEEHKDLILRKDLQLKLV